jgi:crossover junction endodeoxyribonuclease RusA
MKPGAKDAGWELALQRPMRVVGPITVTIAAGVPDRRRRDVDNLCKAVLDPLTVHQVIEDDAKAVSITSRWDTAVAPGRLQVAVAGA